jgi:hypothetical protein
MGEPTPNYGTYSSPSASQPYGFISTSGSTSGSTGEHWQQQQHQ